MKIYRPFFLLALFFLGIFCIPKTSAQRLRQIAVIAPFANKAKGKISVEEENRQLKQVVEQLFSWIALDQEVNDEIQRAQRLFQLGSDPFFERRSHYLAQIMQRQLHGLPARAILREPVSWSSYIWLSVGEKDNEAVGSRVVSVGSPVISHKAVVGVVEEVAPTRCRVRLITDPSLAISVRCVRGGEQNWNLARACQSLASKLDLRDEIQEAPPLSRALQAFAAILANEEEAQFLAKGVLKGASLPFGRSFSHKLKGEGFNYDFADEEGPARDLRTGSVLGNDPIPLICVGDLLITTGLDGVFPPDLPVATVTKIYPLREGGCSYELEASPSAPAFHNLRDVVVLPPL